MSQAMRRLKLEAHYFSVSAAEREAARAACNAPRVGLLRFAHSIGGDRQWLQEDVYVSGKAEARKVVAERGATAWNF